MGISADGRNLMLVAPDGGQFSLRVDDRLATALRRESDRLRGQPTDMGPVPTNPSPREIQDRVRAGMSVGAIAAAAGVSESAVSRFANAVLAERIFVADQARASLIKVHDRNVTLDDAVVRRLQAAGVDQAALRWDSWRRPDGDWTVVCAYPLGRDERSATFVFDPTSRRAAPDDDDARWIIESPAEHSSPPESTGPPADGEAGQQAPDARPGGSGNQRSWDPTHPAARAHLRREQEPRPRS